MTTVGVDPKRRPYGSHSISNRMKQSLLLLLPTSWLCAILSTCFGLFFAVTTQAQNVTRYVSTTGTNSVPASATSWATSTSLLQETINVSGTGDQVWIAAGTYTPTSNTAEANVSFRMIDNVTIYGGFAGNETALSQRPTINPVAGQHSGTILSGDIDRDGTFNRNSYHVFRHSSVNSTAVMDGVVITAGYANSGNRDNKRGAGMVNFDSSPTLTNCTFQSNTALIDGGGIYNKGGTPKLTNCVFENNYASEGGGAITWTNNASMEMTNCVIQNNKASKEGGAFYVYGGKATLTNCLLQNNHADSKGGVAYGTASFSATNCVFRGNTTAEGGVFWFYSNRTTLTNCTVQGNHSTGSGGFMYNWNGAVTVLTNSILWDNSDNKGEIFYNNNTTPLATASYCLFDAASLVSGPGNFSTSTLPFVSTTDLQLRSDSEAIGKGDDAAYTAAGGPSTDLAGNPRTVCPIDMGAYERQDALSPSPSVFSSSTPDGTALQLTGGASYERLVRLDRVNGYQIRQSETNSTGYFLINQTGAYQITVTGTNGCTTTVAGTIP
jgi:predicted outer membrane repeat protein